MCEGALAFVLLPFKHFELVIIEFEWLNEDKPALQFL